MKGFYGKFILLCSSISMITLVLSIGYKTDTDTKVPKQTSLMDQVSVLTKDSYQYTFDMRIGYKECDSFDPSRYMLEAKTCIKNEVFKYEKSQFDSLLNTPMWLGSFLKNKNVYVIELRQRN